MGCRPDIPLCALADAKITSMPRLFHRPPKYRFHKTTKQAIVSFFGKTFHIGPYGSQKSHERYQELLKEWEQRRRREALESSKTCERHFKRVLPHSW